jgi:hypothetical protein
MPQLFHRSANTLWRATIFGAAILVAGLLWLTTVIPRSSYSSGQGVILKQPVPFSHDHHVSGLGIDCRYCHTSVETAAYAGMPPTQTCMNCHSQIWSDSPMLEPVRESYRTGVPIEWTRVYDTPDYVYFDHSIHIAKGIGCVTCHGRVDRMPLMWQFASLKMEWCLDCHRNPERYVQPREEIFNLAWKPPADADALRRRLAEEYKLESLTNCSVCHR